MHNPVRHSHNIAPLDGHQRSALAASYQGTQRARDVIGSGILFFLGLGSHCMQGAAAAAGTEHSTADNS